MRVWLESRYEIEKWGNSTERHLYTGDAKILIKITYTCTAHKHVYVHIMESRMMSDKLCVCALNLSVSSFCLGHKIFVYSNVRVFHLKYINKSRNGNNRNDNENGAWLWLGKSCIRYCVAAHTNAHINNGAKENKYRPNYQNKNRLKTHVNTLGGIESGLLFLGW